MKISGVKNLQWLNLAIDFGGAPFKLVKQAVEPCRAMNGFSALTGTPERGETMQNYVEMFENGLFKGLAPDEAEAFINRCEKRVYPDHTVLFKEMTEATTLYLLLEGEVELKFIMPAQKGEAVLAIRKPGDAIGWSSLVPPHQYTFSGVCNGRVTLLQIDRGSMQAVFATNYHLGYIFMRNIAALSGDRLHRVQDKLAKVLGDEAVNGW